MAGQPHHAAFDVQQTFKRYAFLAVTAALIQGLYSDIAAGNGKVSVYSSVHGFNIKKAAGDTRLPINSAAIGSR